ALTQEVLNHYHTPAVKISIVLFDEIEKASDTLWNLMLGILDKATLTLGDNRTVDFSRAMIFMTSNIGAREMSAMMKPRLGFAGPFSNRQEPADAAGPLSNEMARTGIEAACRKFTPEFINRIDKMVVFKPLGSAEMERILDIELNSVRQRVFNMATGCRFVFTMTPSAKQYLLDEGTNVEYGARHLKRTVERLVVQPLSKLIPSGQILSGYLIEINYESESAMTFSRQDEGMPLTDMAVLVSSTPVSYAAFAAAS